MNDNYKIGDFITVTHEEITTTFEILGADNRYIRLRDNLTLIESTRKRIDFNELILTEKAQIIPENKDERELCAPLSRSFSDYSEKDKIEARRRYKYISAVIEQKPKYYTARYTQPIIDSVTKSAKALPPSVRTLNRWLNSYISSGFSIRGLLPKHEYKGNYKAKVEPQVEPYIQLAIEHFKNDTCPHVNSSHEYMKTLIENDNSFLSKQLKLKVPSIPAFTARLAIEAPAELLEARKGKRVAKTVFRQSKAVRDVELILQRTEIDHTQLDLFVVDDKTKMVWGRPWVTVLLDYKSKSILGFYIGFENPSYLSVSKALQHAMSSKSYVKEEYPEIQNTWLCAGRPAVIATDRGKEFRSIAFQDACNDLNIIIQHNPGKHPWYKGSVESYFKTLNQQLLNDKPGRVMVKIYDSIDYHPEKNAVISMSAFMKIFHIWVIDIYQCEVRTRKKIIPKEVWKEDLDKVPIVIEAPEKLKLIISESFSAHLGNTGIIKDYIVYDSEKLTKYRSKYGFGKIKFKRSRDNLGEIYVLNEVTKKYFKVEAVYQNYAKNLSLYQHKKHMKVAKLQQESKIDIESIAKARIKIMEIVEREMSFSNSHKIASKQRLARYQNIGLQEDGTTKGSLVDGFLKTSSGIPKPQLKNPPKDNANIVPVSDFDGTNNEFTDDLDFSGENSG
ncbi:integrase catalytic domain-containing protein [Psychromonas ossibalaenae]|uniref:integrase catalytic domain-containing protein n=1 Tax=Psychromonas ossibalaenae TaxID=444922 RepID=UPI0003737B77|nr:DDE-type integrase/transposase/recombinase [Psychromonas ossibalaenae]